LLTLPPSVRIFLCTEPVDMRKSFSGLSLAARLLLGQDPMSGHLFVFLNRRRTLMKAIYWDRTGYCILAKRLERGTFHLPSQPTSGARHMEVESAELALILEGIELCDVRRHKRWRARRKVLTGSSKEPIVESAQF